jgi:hypothetical protein
MTPLGVERALRAELARSNGKVRLVKSGRSVTSSLAGERGEAVEKVTGRARKAVEPRHYRHVAGADFCSNRRSCPRSVLAPLATSRNTFFAPAARSWALARPRFARPSRSAHTRRSWIMGSFCNKLTQEKIPMISGLFFPSVSFDLCTGSFRRVGK